MKLFIFLMLISQNEGCIICHSEVKNEYTKSIHYKEKVKCDACHGGDLNAIDIKKAHHDGFIGKPKRKEIIKICSKCHSSPKIMKSYGIPFDQEILYYTSEHGEAFKRGNEEVALCTDCHGHHEILSSFDNNSRTNILNLPRTCGVCHSDFNMMKKYNISSDVVLEYNLGIHAQKLREGNTNSPTCKDCHGTHGATPAGIGEIEKVCGKCHIKTREYFLKSKHAEFWKELGYGECEICHENHYVKKASHKLWKEKCLLCHSKDSKNYKIAEEIYTLFITTQMEILKTEEIIEDLKKIPVSVEDFLGRIEEAKTYLLEAGPVSHSLKLEEIKSFAIKSKSIAQEVQREGIRRKKLFESRKLFLPFLWLFILFTISLIIYIRKR
ncbi:MAG: hypothetical protein ABIM03_04820 [candidate division WOR-3 bacterium]